MSRGDDAVTQWENTSEGGYKLKLRFLTIYVWETNKGCHFRVSNSGAYQSIVSDKAYVDFATAQYQAIRRAKKLLVEEALELQRLEGQI